MDILITLFYILFSICVVYPPTEFVSAGFTIPQVFDSFLGSENLNFIKYHMKRVTITVLIHASLPLGYVITLWCGGVRGEWMLSSLIATTLIPFYMLYKVVGWWENDKSNHPVVKGLLPYVRYGQDWRVIAVDVNVEFRGVDKVSLSLSATSKLIATQMWVIKVSQYNVNIIKQMDCTLVATATDVHNLTHTGEDEVQFVKIEVIPLRDDLEKFVFRMSTAALRELQPRLDRPIRVPEHISLMPPLVERFVRVFKEHVDQNPVYYLDQEVEQCIGCMQNQADVKINKRCESNELVRGGPPPCQQCNCRVLWCCSCMARWWASRAAGAPSTWLAARGACPVCRAVFCLLDVCNCVATPTEPSVPMMSQ